ncbi:MAG: hypothetical protein GF401_07910, partial [Chitinivibrionales bacterium]|nr:hypothetical protein [Chitinivibrionales bacterium]
MKKSTHPFAEIIMIVSLSLFAYAETAGHWTFSAGSGTTVADVSGNGSDGTVAGPARWISQGSESMRFDGLGYVDIDPSAALDLNQQLTIALWTKIDNTDMNITMSLVSKADPSGYELACNPSSNTITIIGENGLAVTASDVDLDTSWNHLAAIIDNGNFSIYVNGSPQTVSDSATLDDSWFADGFHGMLDDIRIMNTALSVSEIESLAQEVPMQTTSSPAMRIGRQSSITKFAGFSTNISRLDFKDITAIKVYDLKGRLLLSRDLTIKNKINLHDELT